MGPIEIKPQMAKLRRGHLVDSFDCGSEALNAFLRRYALTNQSAGTAQTYVAEVGDNVAGYYSLTFGQVEYGDASERMTKGIARHPVPVMLLARLGVDRTWQGKGLGAALLADALRRTAQAADIAGMRALVVHAKDDTAKAFYEYFDFAPLPQDPLHMFLLVKDIRKLFG
jgi:GNAT superfamily N-acetyltransferase